MIVTGPKVYVDGVCLELREWGHIDADGKACTMLECLHDGKRITKGRYYSRAGRDTWLQIAATMVEKKQTYEDIA